MANRRKSSSIRR